MAMQAAAGWEWATAPAKRRRLRFVLALQVRANTLLARMCAQIVGEMQSVLELQVSLCVGLVCGPYAA